jgi:hypothetical protein
MRRSERTPRQCLLGWEPSRGWSCTLCLLRSAVAFLLVSPRLTDFASCWRIKSHCVSGRWCVSPSEFNESMGGQGSLGLLSPAGSDMGVGILAREIDSQKHI